MSDSVHDPDHNAPDAGTGRFRRVARYVLIGSGVVVSLIGLVILSIIVWLWQYEPTTVDELLPDDPDISLDAYDGSMAPEAGAPEILILGTPHFAHEDHDYTQSEFDEINQALAEFDPDLVAVEHLPPDWPQGEGRDWRPGFDLDSYAAEWNMSRDEAEELISGDRGDNIDQCELGRAYFLIRDLANAHFLWDSADCPELEHDEEITDWANNRQEDEDALIAEEVARSSGVDELISMDYQGDDARWFMHEEVPDLLISGQLGDAWRALPEVSKSARELSGHSDEHTDSLNELLTFLNSSEQIGLQYWAYEVEMLEIETNDLGQRQRDNYWLRNEQMFANIDEAAREQDAERVFVVTGAGHKYFLDKLARDAGYRWIDPREYLP